jgi:hypothetical protein
MDDGPSQLLKRATALAGIVIPDDKWARLDELSDSPRVFEHNDVIRLEVLAKRVQVIPFVESYKATGKFKDAEEFYLTVRSLFASCELPDSNIKARYFAGVEKSSEGFGREPSASCLYAYQFG